MITCKPFGTLPTGEAVEAFTLSNSTDVSVEIITYGGIITRLLVPDADGKKADIVLGLNGLDAYLAGHPYFGAITGRVAGRITAGRFELDGEAYALALTNAPNHLHGGDVGFDKKLWTATPNDDADAPSLMLTYSSPDGEEGYPGTLDTTVCYRLNGAALEISYEATTDRATPVCLTNHSYFNLAGEGSGSVLDHIVQIKADTIVPTDEDLTLQGRRVPVVAPGTDFRTPCRLGDAVPHLLKHHGDNYCFRETPIDAPEWVAQLSDPASGRVMDVFTNDTCMQFYTGKFLDGTLTGKSGKAYDTHAGLCMECQGYPDGVNTPEIDDIILRPGQTYKRQTEYRFCQKRL
ncbi:MAG: galactose mutarotase [Verrucomicrobia bacterium]|jgi:aldose 1-epimerase|nr:galactose mutarotase [Verrucomicrobiota bacterium]MBT7067686.1 galactose mutarotase [Verrucomicrobiota bacterium]MBT7699787.1 galactose mutarotase [Verrucomicrobiota bacterium]